MKNIICLIFAPVLFLTAFSANAVLIPVVSGSFGGSSYHVFADSGISWADAQSNAIIYGGNLVTITSQLEDDFVHSLVDSTTLGQVWAGGIQPSNTPDPEGPWTWVTGEPWSYINWSLFEPNNVIRAGIGEMHLGINWSNCGDSRQNCWNDESALANITGYVVEKVPEPSIIALFGLGLLGLGFAGRRKVRS